MSQQLNSPRWRAGVRRFSRYSAALAALLLALVVPRVNAQAACNVVYTTSPQNSSAFGAAITIQNTGTTALSSWTLTWAFANGQTVSSLWNGIETQSGANVTVKNESYNGSIAAGGSLTGIGFNGTWNGTTNAVPTSFAINGTTCGGAATGSFTLKPSAATLAVTQGSSATDTISVTDVSPFTGSVTLAASGLPSGVTAAFGTDPTTGSSVLTLTASSTATAGTSTVTITGTSGTLTASTSISLVANGSLGSFTLKPSAAALSIAQSASGTDTLTVTDVSPFAGSVTLAASGLPSGVTAAFGTNPTTGSSVLTLTASATATAGTSTVTITGTSGTLTASTTIALTVTSSGCTPTAIVPFISVNGGSTWTQESSATVSSTTTAVDLGPQPASGGTWSWTGPNGFTSTARQINSIALSTGANAYVATYTNPAACKSTDTFTITVTGTTGSFTLKPSAATLSVAQGSSATDTITVTDVSPFTGSVTLAASGLPTGVTAAFGTNPTTGSSVVTFTASATATAGTSTVTITGTSGTLTASTTLSLTVTGAGGFTLAVLPPITIPDCGSGTVPVKVTDTGGFAGNVALSASGLPSGISGAFGTNPITSGSSTLTLGVGCSVPAGTYLFTIIGTSGAITETTTITITVTAAGAFVLTPSASTLSIAQGASGTDTITVTDISPFAGSVTLAASGLPTGVTAAFATNPTTGTSVLTLSTSNTTTVGTSTITVTGISGTLTATTAIGLTVTGSITANATVTVNESSTGPAVTNQILGMNMAAWYDVVTNETAIVDAFQTAGIKAVRWPGGSWSDLYHWQTNTNCEVAPFGTDAGQPDSDNIFANFVKDLAVPAGLDVALTADYGTDAACTGPGAPSEAAAWAAAALTDGITVSHMTVGNEVYGSTWEEDLHSPANNSATYAAAVVGSSGYYQLIKAASPNTLVGVVVEADNTTGGWDNTVLANAKGSYDFVEYHYYPETPGSENDTTLVQQDAQQLTTNINTIKSELTKWGTPGTPIYVGEIGAPYSNPGKQSWSITQGLYAGQVLGELMNDGVSRLTWWIGFGNCNGTSGNDSSSLYGWQDFGAYNVFSDGPSDTTCPGDGVVGSLNPTARAFQLFSSVAVNGESVLTTSVTGDTTDVVAYAATNSGGTALVLFNRNETTSEPVSITLSAQTTAKTVTVETYDKAIYDLSGSPTGNPADPAGTNTWAPPTTTTISSPTLPLTLTLAPWSMNVVMIH